MNMRMMKAFLQDLERRIKMTGILMHMSSFCVAAGILLYIMQLTEPERTILSESDRIKHKFYGTARWFILAFILLKSAIFIYLGICVRLR